jgi:hypothetical protein
MSFECRYDFECAITLVPVKVLAGGIIQVAFALIRPSMLRMA